MSEKRRSMLQAGEPMPDVELEDADGRKLRTRDLVGEKVLVLYFYPKDDTPGCTAEACSFRDQYEDFVEAGAAVVGVSSDPGASHRAFAAKHRLPFTLLTDASGAARAAFGVKSTLGLLPGRATFVIDRGGIVRDAFSSQLRAREHVSRALEIVRGLAGQPAAAEARQGP